MNDKAYEQELDTLQQEMLLVLDELHNDLGSWNKRDILAAQRALQVLIESLIGLARYVYQNRYGISVSKSRSAIDGLHNKRDLSETDFQLAIRMVGFRNVLVHDYLDVNRAILEAIVRKRLYQDVRRIARDLFVLVNAKPASGQP